MTKSALGKTVFNSGKCFQDSVNSVKQFQVRENLRKVIRRFEPSESSRLAENSRKTALAKTEQVRLNQNVLERKRFAMKTRLIPLESRLHNSPTPEEVGREAAIISPLFRLPVSEKPLRLNPPFRTSAAELGNWNASGFRDNDPSLIRNFSGAMDEFCLFSRALNAAEIRALHSAGKPQPDLVAGLNKN